MHNVFLKYCKKTLACHYNTGNRFITVKWCDLNDNSIMRISTTTRKAYLQRLKERPFEMVLDKRRSAVWRSLEAAGCEFTAAR